MKNKITCIISKICCIGILIVSILYIPMNVYWHSQNPDLGFELSLGNVILSLVFLSIFTLIGWMFLLKTNNPITRYNIFSINPKWSGEMNGSLEDNPGQIFELDKPDDLDVKRVNRNKKIEQLLK